MAKTRAPRPLSMEASLERILKRLRQSQPVRARLPGAGRLQLEQPFPTLVVWRRPAQGDKATERLFCGADKSLIAGPETPVEEIVEAIVREVSPSFGAFLLLEGWAGPPSENGGAPCFRIVAPAEAAAIPLAEQLQNELAGLRIGDAVCEVRLERGATCAPPGLEPLLLRTKARDLRCLSFGLELPPIYRDAATGEAFPAVARALRRETGLALRRTAYAFVRSWTTARPESFNVLGGRSIPRVVWQVDRQIAEIADSFDYLLQVTPVNALEAWEEFERSGYDRNPAFQYRPLRIEPSLLKRRLFAAPIERVDDVALYQIFREKQDELDRQITLLTDMNTPRFLHGSVQLFGGVDPVLLRACRETLQRFPPTATEKTDDPPLDSETFARHARDEVSRLRKQWPQLKARVEVRDDIGSGLMVSQGSLLVGRETTIPPTRVEALIQHEIGTHVVTYWNGRAQPFRQLYSGLAGYDTLQEGIAVIAEYLVGGLTSPRRRLLAARVVAARHLLDGATFVETFRELHKTWGYPAKGAFTITMRIYRGGGLTKDAVYARGVQELLDYLSAGHELELLLLGKIALEHVPILRELRERGVLVAGPLRPSYLDTPETATRLERIRSGLTLSQIILSRAREETEP